MKMIFAAISLFLAMNVNAAQIEIKVKGGNSELQTEGRYSYNFGTVWLNSRAVASFNLRNTGSTPLTYSRAYIYGGDYSANHSCERGILPNETCTFSIYYWPVFEGMSSGQFVLSFIEEDVVFDLWGQARRM